jgi:hypothetical protein
MTGPQMMRNWLTRGPSIIGHHHSGGSGLGATLLGSFTRAVGWYTGAGLFHAFGGTAVLVGVIVLIVVWVRSRRRGGAQR